VAYLNNWIDEAEMDLLEAEKKNYQDFLVHHILGNIYFYHKTNYKKALEYYQKSAKYATHFSKEHTSNALLYVAMVYCKLGQLADAYNSTKIALELTPDDPHVLYHHARYAAKIGNIDEFLNALKESVYKEPTYLITAEADDMLSGVKEEVKKLAKDLRDEKKQEVSNLIQIITSGKEEAETLRKDRFKSWEKRFRESWEERLRNLNKQQSVIEERYKRNSYFDLLQAKQIAQNVANEICSLVLKQLQITKNDGGGFPPLTSSMCYNIAYIASVLTLLIAAIAENWDTEWTLLFFFLLVFTIPPLREIIFAPLDFDKLDIMVWGIFFLLALLLMIAPFIIMPILGILAVLNILGITHDIETVTVKVLFLFSGIVLPILLLVLNNKREKKRLKAIDNKLEKFRKYQETIKNRKTIEPIIQSFWSEQRPMEKLHQWKKKKGYK